MWEELHSLGITLLLALTFCVQLLNCMWRLRCKWEMNEAHIGVWALTPAHWSLVWQAIHNFVKHTTYMFKQFGLISCLPWKFLYIHQRRFKWITYRYKSHNANSMIFIWRAWKISLFCCLEKSSFSWAGRWNMYNSICSGLQLWPGPSWQNQVEMTVTLETKTHDVAH